nr:ORF8 protein [Severe acute respiratory syndrome coronavirus 2]
MKFLVFFRNHHNCSCISPRM